MGYVMVKLCISALLIVAIGELAKRYSFAAALLASLPITSLLAFVWLYVDTKDTAKIATLSTEIFWLVIPSLAFFLVLPVLLKQGVNFWAALAVASAVTALAYGAMTLLFAHLK